MQTRKSSSILTGILLLGTISLCGQQAIPTGGARSFAMGGTGLTFQDVHAVWTNPAGIGGVQGPSAAGYVEQRFGLEELRTASLAAALPTGNGGVGVFVQTFGFSTYREQQVGVGYGLRLTDVLRLGLQVGAYGWSIETYGNQWLISGSVGVQTDITDNLNVALRVTNPVRQEVAENTELPSLLSLGLNYRPNPSIQLLAEVEKDIDFPARVRVGLDYQLLDPLQLRLGVATDPALLSLGVSYRLVSMLRLDLAVQYDQILGVSPGFGLVYQPDRL